MSDDETANTEGSRAAWRQMLALCLRNLSDEPDDAQRTVARLTLQLEQARAMLRTVCRDHGDNEWSDELSLADVIDRHLARHLGPGPAATRLQRMTEKRDRWRAFSREIAETLGVEWKATDGGAMMAQARERIAAQRAALTEALDGWHGWEVSASSYPVEENPSIKRIGELRKFIAEAP